ncbi:IS3 family transposase [Mycolicibacter engbaekii]|uniref:IS3 family transposase n=1 Tax=Mycolicibacter engbaekii TaxID=188915 RepID=UPI000D6A7D2B|nr:IS3 family transposase [Mycolicibacter engbaekii]
MSGKRKKYTPEFREQAARLVIETGRPIAHVAAEIGVGEQLLGRWVRVAREAAGAGDNGAVLDSDERAELERLRKENAELPLDRQFLKKSRGLLCLRTEPVEAYGLIEAEKANYAITRMCELLDVSRSGFYKWRKSQAAGPSPAARRRAELDVKVAALHEASDGVYGAPRILADLRDAGETVSRKTVAASLRRQGLAGISPRTFAPVTTVVDLDAPPIPDLVKRRFDTGRLDGVWTSDITYLRTGEGWLYLCAVRDGCSRRVIGWAIDEHLHTDLVEDAVAMAVAMRGELAAQVVFHADRGCQYTSAQLARFARKHDLARSVGRTGVCWDNAQQESFWATMKVEFYDRYLWPTKAAAKLAVGDWIERVYNRRRRHSSIGMITPVEYENRITQTAQAA